MCSLLTDRYTVQVFIHTHRHLHIDKWSVFTHFFLCFFFPFGYFCVSPSVCVCLSFPLFHPTSLYASAVLSSCCCKTGKLIFLVWVRWNEQSYRNLQWLSCLTSMQTRIWTADVWDAITHTLVRVWESQVCDTMLRIWLQVSKLRCCRWGCAQVFCIQYLTEGIFNGAKDYRRLQHSIFEGKYSLKVNTQGASTGR